MLCCSSHPVSPPHKVCSWVVLLGVCTFSGGFDVSRINEPYHSNNQNNSKHVTNLTTSPTTYYNLLQPTTTLPFLTLKQPYLLQASLLAPATTTELAPPSGSNITKPCLRRLPVSFLTKTVYLESGKSFQRSRFGNLLKENTSYLDPQKDAL